MLKFLKFLEASGLDSSRPSVLLNLLWCCLWHWCIGVFQDLSQDVLVCRNAVLGRLLFLGVCGKVSDTWRSLIGDACHSLIRGFLRLFLQDTWHLLIGQNILIFKVTHVRNWLDRLCHCLHMLMCGICHYLHAPMCDWHFACFFLYFYFITLGKFLLIPKWWW